MRKFSTVLGSTAAGALLATMGVAAASAAGPDGTAPTPADNLETVSAALGQGLTQLRTAGVGGAGSAAATGTSSATPAASAQGASAGGAATEGASAGGAATEGASTKGGSPAVSSSSQLPHSSTNQGWFGDHAVGVNGGCTGVLLRSHDINHHETGEKLGHAELWYSSANNGTNCVMTYTNDYAYSSAGLWVEGVADYPISADWGDFHEYAGGAYATNTNGHCVKFSGAIDWNDYESEWGNCG